MIQILENIYAHYVPIEAHSFTKKGRDMFYKADFINMKDIGRCTELEFNFKILGTITSDEIDFDVSPFVKSNGSVGKEKLYPFFGKSLKASTCIQTAFRSALTAAGITKYEKLIIIKKT